jgi:hypothetical protein
MEGENGGEMGVIALPPCTVHFLGGARRVQSTITPMIAPYVIRPYATALIGVSVESPSVSTCYRQALRKAPRSAVPVCLQAQ